MAQVNLSRESLSIPTPEWEEFYGKHHDVVPKLVGTPEHLRKIMVILKTRAQSLAPQIVEGLTIEDVTMITFDGSSIQLRIYTPKPQSTTLPGLIYIHGGGWTLGDLDGEDGICRIMCVKAQVVLVSVDYRLAPEHPFPVGLEDAWEALNWTIQNSSDLHIDPQRMVIGGSSSGGNFAAALAHRARDHNIPLVGQILRIPSVCHISVYPPELKLNSLEELKDAHLLSKRSMELFWGYYNAPNPGHRDVSPLLADTFEGLAPAYIQIAGMDPLRDEGLAYAQKLKRAGVPLKLDVYPGLPHAFGYFPELSQAAKNGVDLVDAIKAMLTTGLQNLETKNYEYLEM